MFKRFWFIIIIFVCFSLTNAVSIKTPGKGASENEKVAGGGNGDISSSEGGDAFWQTLIQDIIYYMWIAVGVVLFGLLIYSGFMLMFADGDQETMKKTTNMFKYSIIGIFVIIFSYTGISLLVNLF